MFNRLSNTNLNKIMMIFHHLYQHDRFLNRNRVSLVLMLKMKEKPQ